MNGRKTPDRARELFDEHYESGARCHGDEQPKKDAAAARRVATGLRNTLKDFGRLLSPAQQQSMRDAATSMTSLAADLDEASRLARQRQVDHTSADLARRTTAADLVAAERWAGDDRAMLVEVRQLAAFVDQSSAFEVGAWLVQRHSGCELGHFPTSELPRGRRLIDMLGRDDPSEEKVLQLRRRGAEYLTALREATRRRDRLHRGIWDVGIDDFDAWCAWQREIVAAVVPPRTA